MTSTSKEYPEFPRRKVGMGVWLRNSHYAQHMVREWTSFFVAVFSLIYIYELYLFYANRLAYANLISNPVLIGFNIIVLIFVSYHAVTWFYLTGAVQRFKIGRKYTQPWQALVVNLIVLAIVFYVVITIFSLR
jgi:fumarate reductase subunit C